MDRTTSVKHHLPDVRIHSIVGILWLLAILYDSQGNSSDASCVTYHAKTGPRKFSYTKNDLTEDRSAKCQDDKVGKASVVPC